MNRIDICFRCVRYRMLDELKSRTLLGDRCGCNFCGISAIGDFRELRMQNFNGKYPYVIENVRCRCKICEGSILKSQKRQDVDAIVHVRQAEKHLQVMKRARCRYVGLKMSICKNEYQGLADTSAAKRASATANKSRI